MEQELLQRNAELITVLIDIKERVEKPENRSVTPLDLERYERFQLKNVQRGELLSMQEERRAAAGGAVQPEGAQEPVGQRVALILRGDTKAIGWDKPFDPSRAYNVVADTLEKTTLGKQGELARESRVESLMQYLTNVRSSLTSDRAEVVEMGLWYQLRLDEIARVQNQIGRMLHAEGATPLTPVPTEEATKQYLEVIESYESFRAQQIDNAALAMEDMLAITWTDEIERKWNTEGRAKVAEIVEKMAKLVSAWIPSENQDDAGIGSRIGVEAYRKVIAPLIGTKRSREEQEDALKGSLLRQLGVPEGRDWADISPEEKQKIMQKCQSIMKAKENFDATTIAHVRQSNDLLRNMPNASTFPGEAIDDAFIQSFEEGNKRVTSITPVGQSQYPGGEKFDGVRINGESHLVTHATALVLLCRQRARDVGSIDGQRGMIGQFDQYLQGLEGVVQEHVAFARALHEIQEAWEEYAFSLLKAAGITAITPSLLAFLYTVALAAYPAVKVTAKMARVGSRLAWNVGGRLARIPDRILATGPAQKALGVLRSDVLLAYQPQWLQAAEKSLTGKLAGLQATKALIRTGRFAGKAGSLALSGAAYPVFVMEGGTAWYRAATETNPALREEDYHQRNIAGGTLAGFGLMDIVAPALSATIALPTSIGLCIGGAMRTTESDVRKDWLRKPEEWRDGYAAPDLLQKLNEHQAGKDVGWWATNYGGTIAYSPFDLRGGSTRSQDQREQVMSVAKADRATRGTLYEAYFQQEALDAVLAQPQNRKFAERIAQQPYQRSAILTEMLAQKSGVKDSASNAEQLHLIVRYKMHYLRRLTTADSASSALNDHGNASLASMGKVSPDVLERADTYAKLRLTYDTLVAQGQKKGDVPLMIPIVKKDGSQELLNLEHLLPGGGTREQLLYVVAQYHEHSAPAMEYITMNMIGKQKDFPTASVEGRRMILGKIIHSIHEAERRIRENDWSADVDLSIPWTSVTLRSGETQAKNVVRAYLALRLQARINENLHTLLSPARPEDTDLAVYEKLLDDCRTICQEVPNLRSHGQATDEVLNEYYGKAWDGLREERRAVAMASVENPLYSLFSNAHDPLLSYKAAAVRRKE